MKISVLFCVWWLLLRAAFAHDASLHGFSMVNFNPPFPAPAFALETLNGAKGDLQDYRGRFVVLNFWATWCPPCLEEMPSLEALQQRYRDKNLRVLAISSDEEGAEIVNQFIVKLGTTFPILLDPDQQVSDRYGAGSLPVTFVLDPEGRVVAAAQGARDWNSPEAHSVFDELTR